jgi:hypothetical protein
MRRPASLRDLKGTDRLSSNVRPAELSKLKKDATFGKFGTARCLRTPVDRLANTRLHRLTVVNKTGLTASLLGGGTPGVDMAKQNVCGLPTPSRRLNCPCGNQRGDLATMFGDIFPTLPRFRRPILVSSVNRVR